MRRKVDLDTIYKRGVVVSLHISFWTGRKIIHAQDLGLKDEELDRELVALGSRYLVSKKLRNIPRNSDAKARSVLMHYGKPFIIANTYYVPYANMQLVTKKLEEIRSEFNHAANQVINSYRKEYDEISLRLQPFIKGAFLNAKARKYEKSARSFKDDFLKRFKEAYPTESYVRRCYNFDYLIFELNSPSGIKSRKAEDIVEAQHQYQQEINKRINNFVDSVELVMAKDVKTFCDLLITKLKKGEVLSEVNIRKLKLHIEQLRAFNLRDDSRIETQLNHLMKQINTYGGKAIRDDESLSDKITDAVNAVINQVEKVTDFHESGNVKRRFV